ncbi:MAG: hypothetical protein B6D62_02775 [Candidatus Cloacimonas sp. 4484_275]|nr:MAG: hypothetical protein B6D62_02775 [Candidatus Cloacimonas sp. 4484_275]
MKKIHLSEKGKVFLGVCGGLAEYFKIDVSIVRLIFLISIFFGGTGILIYLILYALLPQKADDDDIIDVEPTEIDGEKPERCFHNTINIYFDEFGRRCGNHTLSYFLVYVSQRR